MKVLAAQADARWASKPSFLDAPDKQQPAQMLESSHSGAGPRQANAVEEAGRREGEPQSILKSEEEIAGDAAEEKANESTLKVPKKMKKNRGPKDSPWNEVVKGNPGDEWQPNEWRPSPGRRRS
jgi:NADH dehydrogenase [ubiquinone] 1 alpha subcomplex assembly factor 2